MDARVEGDGDLVQRRDARRRLGALDLRQERHREARALGHLLEREALLLAEVADGLADDPMQLLFGGAGEPLLLHRAADDLAQLFDGEGLAKIVQLSLIFIKLTNTSMVQPLQEIKVTINIQREKNH